MRAEAYNVFNTTQYQGVNTVATFDFATGVQTNPAFGAISQGVRANSNRVIQLGVRLHVLMESSRGSKVQGSGPFRTSVTLL